MTDWTAGAIPAEDLTPRIARLDHRVSLCLATNIAQAVIDFPWWDTLAEVTPLLNWCRDETAPDFSDADQGWTFDAAHRGERVHFRQGDLDTGEIFATLSVDRAVFIARLENAMTSLTQPPSV